MISTIEMNILIALKRLGKRNGVFPPVMLTLRNQFSELEYNEFFQHMLVLQDKGYLKIAAGKSRGIFITPAGTALAARLEQEYPSYTAELCSVS